jgi:hypothetical protein
VHLVGPDLERHVRLGGCRVTGVAAARSRALHFTRRTTSAPDTGEAAGNRRDDLAAYCCAFNQPPVLA